MPPLMDILQRLAARAANEAIAESRRIIRVVSRNVLNIALAWVGIVTLLAALRIFLSPTPPADISQLAQLAIPYLCVALAPVAGFVIGKHAFIGEARHRRSKVRLAIIGRWNQLSARDAIRHPSFGPVGLLASLIIGMLLNVVLRTFEFAMAIPALTTDAPAWGYSLFWLASADTAIMSFFYGVCFVMALRSVPLFPKMLLFVWTIDILSQLTIARAVSAYAMPGDVVVALQGLLAGNINKVLISMAIWLPYLILSERINVTFRHRIAA